MSTFPRSKSYTSKSLLASPAASLVEPPADFDSGINTSTAWTGHLGSEHAQEASFSDEEPDKEGAGPNAGRQARALYDFDGNPEFGELTLKAGTDLRILKDDVGDGWSLVECEGKSGLLPQTYYTYTSNFVKNLRDSLTPRNSPRNSNIPPNLEPQNTGTYLPNFRESLLGGRSLNRFSSFVTSGAEDWVLNGCSETLLTEPQKDSTDGAEGQVAQSRISTDSQTIRHFVDTGPTWRSQIPPFRVMVHSPYKRASSIAGGYTAYLVTSTFESDESKDDPRTPTHITVHRRFSHFISLHTALTRRLPGIAIYPLPGKQYAGRFSNEFVEARRGDLERYLARLIRHPVARYAEVLTFFLSCEDENEWHKLLPQHLSLPPAGPAFYARVYHPSFNLDLEDASDSVDRFSQHVTALGKSIQWLRGVFGKVRAVRSNEAASLRLLSYSFLGLITSTPLDSSNKATYGVVEEEEEDDQPNKPTEERPNGLYNHDGAWCWRDNCEGCLGLTKALQRTAEYLQHIASLLDDSARQKQLTLHEHIKDLAHPRSLYDPIVETHRASVKRFQEALSSPSPNSEVAARCETVLNTTMAEFDIYHTQKAEDFKKLAEDYLDGEIELHQQILNRLTAARSLFSGDTLNHLASQGPRQPSMFERELSNMSIADSPPSQPSPHVFDSVPLRPVSAAVHEGVGMLFGNPSIGRTSVFSRFW